MKTLPPVPLFSIITVTRNAEAALPATLASVDAQTCDLYEHLVIDGASTDGTVDLVCDSANPRRRIFSAPDRGIYDAMNKGLGRARGEYLIFLNAGDRLHSPDTLQILADAAMAHDFPGVLYGQTDIIDASGHRLADRHLRAPERLSLANFRDGMVVCHQSFVALRRIVDVFDTRYRFSADYEWCIRVLQHSRQNLYIPHVISDYLFDGLSTRHRRASLAERFRIMCYYFGFASTVRRHLQFVPRYLHRRKLEKTFAKPQQPSS